MNKKMDTIWRRKRAQSGLTCANMAKELGVEYNKYKAIEKGDIKMPSKLMDKFNEITNRGKHVNKLEQLDKQGDIDKFWDEVSVKEDGQYKLIDKMKDFNIDTYKELGLLLGYKDGTIFSTRLAHPELAPIEFKTKLYNFFQDELNRQLPKEKKKKKRNVKKFENKIKEMEAIMEIADKIILPISNKPIDEKESEEISTVDKTLPGVEEAPILYPSVPTTSQLFGKYNMKIKDLEKEMADLKLKMLELEKRKEIYEEVLSDLTIK